MRSSVLPWPGEQGCAEASDTFHERLTPLWWSSHLCLVPGDTLFSQDIEQETKKQTERKENRQRTMAREARHPVVLALHLRWRLRPYFGGDLFQWDDKLPAGICCQWISRRAPLNRGFRALAGKRAISATRMSALLNLPIQPRNTAENTVQDSLRH